MQQQASGWLGLAPLQAHLHAAPPQAAHCLLRSALQLGGTQRLQGPGKPGGVPAARQGSTPAGRGRATALLTPP